MTAATRVRVSVRFALLALLAAWGCQSARDGAAEDPRTPDASPPEPVRSTPWVDEATMRAALRLSPLPDPPPDPTNAVYEDPGAARLGQALFFDERLSKDGDTSCATCHVPEREWTDARSLAMGKARLDRHTMSLWNVAYNRWNFWDGRADSLWAQALVPLEHPLEHATSRLQIAHVLHDAPELRRAYESVFGPLPDLDDEARFPATGRPVTEREIEWIEAEVERRAAASESDRAHTHAGTGSHFVHPHQRTWDSMRPEDQGAVTRVFVNVGKAIAAFERQLVSRRAPFDVFIEGVRENDTTKLAALSPEAQRGLSLFLGRARCNLCHHGPTFSDLEFHDARVSPSAAVATPDAGRTEGLALLKESEFHGAGPWSDDPEDAGRVRMAFLPTHLHGGSPEFKTPSLRNVALTPPYMHQGQLAALDDVLEHYSTLSGEGLPSAIEKTLVPLELSAAERSDLIRFLESLSDTEIAPELLGPPLLEER